MSTPWVISAAADRFDAARRDAIRHRLERLTGPSRLLLVTCHRVELYGLDEVPANPAVPPRLGEAAVVHLHRVAAGLESAVVGEDEVLHQVRQALAGARASGPVDPALARLVESAIAAGRRARAAVPPRGVGLAERALHWLEGFGALAGRSVLVVGAGSMGVELARAAARAGAGVRVASRHPRRGAMSLEAAAEAAPRSAAVAVALAGTWSVLEGSPELPPIADLSSPSALPAEVRARLGHRFLGIDDLFLPSADGGEYATLAGRAADQGAREFLGWYRARAHTATIRALREQAERRRAERVDRLLRRSPELDPRQRALVELLSRQLTDDLLHEPLRALRSDPEGGAEAAARRLFAL